MNLQNAAWVLVSDGAKALLLVNKGDPDFPNLHLIRKWKQDVPADHELRSAAPGHVFASKAGSSRRSSYDEPDLHEQAEVEFTSAVARFLCEKSDVEAIPELIIVAPPRTLGQLRKELPRKLSDRVTAEIPKDLAKHPISAIEELLVAHQ